MTEPDEHREGKDPPAPPATQEEVIASAFEHLARMREVARRAADRGMQGEGPVAETARDVRDAARGAVESVRRRLGNAPADRRKEDGGSPED